jgi:TonB-dependent starch-binding outer membrane protein SusC
VSFLKKKFNQNLLFNHFSMKNKYQLWRKGLTLLFLLASFNLVLAQERQVTGQVTSFDDGSELPGVNVTVKGSRTGTITDLDGKYRLNVPAGATLVFSYVGYTTEEVLVGNQSVINVELMTDIQTLTDVVVIGYGEAKKKDVTGSIQTVTSKDFNAGQIATPDQLLVGKVAGVNITPNSGQPGAGARIRIRGGSSLNASNDPLIVIDGVPLTPGAADGATDPLSFINPNDIETFTILKDASATAIYGSRASNGVIIITTKKGKKDQPLSINYDVSGSISTPANNVDMMNADEFRAFIKKRNRPGEPDFLGDADTNWQDLIYRNAFTQNHNLSLSGSVKSIPYRVSYNYFNQEGILKGGRLQRNTVSANISPKLLDDHLKIDVNWKGSVNDNVFANMGAIGNSMRMDPTQPVYGNDERFDRYGGYWEWIMGNGNPTDLAPRNPLSLIEQPRFTSMVYQHVGNAQFDYKFHFLPSLRANLNMGYESSMSSALDFQPMSMAGVHMQGGNVQERAQTRENRLLDFYLQYDEDLKGLRSRISVQGGYSYQDFMIDEPRFPLLREDGSVIRPATIDQKFQNTLISFFGRVNYSLMDKYVFTATIRRDGSSRFHPDNRWGVFPAFAAAWNVHEEGFLKGSSVVSDLKVRAGYGVTGQQDTGWGIRGFYPYLAGYEYGDPSAQYRMGTNPDGTPRFVSMLRPASFDRNIRWEQAVTYNAGVDFGLFNGKVLGTLDYYFRDTHDLLSEIPAVSGTNLQNRVLTNLGRLQNRGVEATLNYNVIHTNKVQWSVGANATYNINKIVSLAGLDDDAVGIEVGGIEGGTGNMVQIHSVGYPSNTFYLQKQKYDANGKPLQGQYEDGGEKYLSRFSGDPRMFFGFYSNLSYGKWNAGFVIRGNINNYVYNNVRSARGFGNAANPNSEFLVNVHRDVLNSGFVTPQYHSDYYLENATFARIENITFGYNVGEIFNGKARMRVNAAVQNAFVFTKYTGLDPEHTNGIDRDLYPRARMFTLGLNINI